MNVALLGFGVVGKGVYELIIRDHKDIHVSYILEKNDELLKDVIHLKADSIDTIVNDPSIDVIIELIGGKTIAYDFIMSALTHGKHVITANKALLSTYLKPLNECAIKHHVSLRYEASVGGAIIVLDTLSTIQKANPIQQIKGIINGSTNYILTSVFSKHLTFDQAIAKAFALGYLEKGSNDDMDGLDLLRKINLLSMMSYHTIIDEKKILNMPLSRLSKHFIHYVKSKQLTMKYVAYSKQEGQHITIYLVPMIMSFNHAYAAIDDALNIIDLYGKYHHQTFIGEGAGRYPTASAVVYDLLRIHQPLAFNDQETYVINEQPIVKWFVVEYKNHVIKKVHTSLQDLFSDTNVICFAEIEDGVYDNI